MSTGIIRDTSPEKKALLIQALKKGHIDPSYYSLEGYKEEAVCIEKSGKHWLVYDGERGLQNNLEKYRDFEVAGYRLINRLSDSDETEAVIMVNYLAHILSHAAANSPEKKEKKSAIKPTSVKRTNPARKKVAAKKVTAKKSSAKKTTTNKARKVS